MTCSFILLFCFMKEVKYFHVYVCFFPPVIFLKILVYAKFTEILYTGKTKCFL